jgi:FixJ family two-component response regulator
MLACLPTVFVVDDDRTVRESLALLIESAGWLPEPFATGREFLARPRAPAPSCLVLDVVLPDLDGWMLQQLVADRSDMPTIFISGHGDVPVAVRAMKAGAADFFTKPLSGDALLAAIGHAIDRSRAASGAAEHVRALHARYATLSPREQEVMGRVVAGRLNKQVGGELGISEITVKAHRGQVMRKMMAGSLADLVRMAARIGQG